MYYSKSLMVKLTEVEIADTLQICHNKIMDKSVLSRDIRKRALFAGERVGEIYNFDKEPHIYTVEKIKKDGRPSDSVILDIHTSTEPCVLIGGNSLRVRVIAGFGRLTMLDLGTGKRTRVFLDPNDTVIVPSSNTLYFYENMSDEPNETLVVRDDCDGFNPINEPAVEDVVAALTHSLGI